MQIEKWHAPAPSPPNRGVFKGVGRGEGQSMLLFDLDER